MITAKGYYRLKRNFSIYSRPTLVTPKDSSDRRRNNEIILLKLISE